MYLGILLIGLGIVLMLFKWWAICIFLLIFILRYTMLIFKEEKKLQVAFPDDYASYQKRTTRIFPKMSLVFRKELSTYLPLKLPWLEKEIGPVISVLVGTLLIKSWLVYVNQGITICLNQAATLLCIIILFIGVAGYLHRQTIDKEKQCYKSEPR
jgi:Ca2+/Na+ antiporter